MAITFEQFMRKQKQLKSGWNYRLDSYGRDEVRREIPLENGEKIVCTIYFSDDFDKASWKYTGLNIINMNISLWRRSGDFWSSSGLGKTCTVGEKVTKRLFKYLAVESGKITDDFILEIANANDRKLRKAEIIGG